MKYSLLFSLIFFFALSCQNGTTSTTDTTESSEESAPQDENESTDENNSTFNDSIQVPEGLDFVSEALGNLDDDDADEKVVVYEREEINEDLAGKERLVYIYNKGDEQWELLEKFEGGVLSSNAGGAFGDPFIDVAVDRKAIVISHEGGSRSRWRYVHRFRNQNDDWQLIGATSSWGTPCMDWEEYDYNLSTGKVVNQKFDEDCDSEGDNPARKSVTETTFDAKIDKLPSLNNFVPGDNELKVPGDDRPVLY